MAFSISWALSSASIQNSPSIGIVDSDRDDEEDDDEEEDEDEEDKDDEESDILSWRSAILKHTQKQTSLSGWWRSARKQGRLSRELTSLKSDISTHPTNS